MTATTQPAPTSTAASGYTWPPLRLYNAVAARLPRVRRLPGPDELRAAARRASGLSDFGDPAYETGLMRFRDALAAEADLTPAGQRFARTAMVNALRNRLAIERELTAEPAIRARPLGPALVVLGLPRSGTTLVQNLLTRDPANRSLRQWEASHPAPPPVPGGEEADPRVRAAQRATWRLDRIAPSARSLHPTGAHLATECVTLFANSFASMELSTIYQVPSYTRWLLQTDMRPHYAYYADQLRLLSWYDRRSRWSLKSPAHLFWIPELLGALPEARLVLLHRDPAEVLASFCSLATVLAATNTRAVDRHRLGAFWLDAWADGVTRAEQARTRLPSDRVHDLPYRALVADPVDALRRLYDAFALPFGADVASAVAQHTLLRDEGGPREHRYALEDFGLSAGLVRERFAAAGPERWR